MSGTRGNRVRTLPGSVNTHQFAATYLCVCSSADRCRGLRGAKPTYGLAPAGSPSSFLDPSLVGPGGFGVGCSGNEARVSRLSTSIGGAASGKCRGDVGVNPAVQRSLQRDWLCIAATEVLEAACRSVGRTSNLPRCPRHSSGRIGPKPPRMTISLRGPRLAGSG
jgi:hypothetical protein